MGSVVKGIGGMLGIKSGGRSGGMLTAGTISGADKAAERARERESVAKQRSGTAAKQRQGLIYDLQQQAAGKGPSLAGAQLKSASDRNLSQQLAAAASQRGGSAASTQRQLAQHQSQAGQQVAQQSGQARIQEQNAARQQLGQQIGQEQQLADTMTNQFLAQGFNIEQARQQAMLALQTGKQQSRDAARGRESALFGSLLGAGAQVGAAATGSPSSDERGKENISSAKKDTKSFLDALNAKSYNYKDPEGGPGRAHGRRFGIMAQDLEKSKMGASLVMDTPHGKMIDAVQGFGAVLAAQSELNKRLNSIENKKKKKG